MIEPDEVVFPVESTPSDLADETSAEETLSASHSSAPPVDLSVEPTELVVTHEFVGKRVDIYIADHFPAYSRMHLRKVIHAGGVSVNGKQVKSSFKVREGQRVSIHLPPVPTAGPIPENIPLDILFEDEHMAAINKPPDMVVHPARGHWKGTLTAALAFHFQNLSSAGGPARPGVVHRLDRETSGVIVIAKTNRAHFELASQFEDRTTEKEYLAITAGAPNHDRDIIDQPIGIHPFQREKMAIRANHSTSRESRTFYEVVERFGRFAFVRLLPKTGRTHQLRVHLEHIGCPVLCDRQYGGRTVITRGEIRRDPSDTHVLLDRQALHAHRLKIAHPITREPLEFVAPIPADMQSVLDELRAHPAPVVPTRPRR